MLYKDGYKKDKRYKVGVVESVRRNIIHVRDVIDKKKIAVYIQHVVRIGKKVEYDRDTTDY